MCTEEDSPAPINHYARTKALAETVVMNGNPSALVLRTNFFGWGHPRRHSISDWLIYNLRMGNEVPLFTNVFFTPILIDTLALAAHQLVQNGASGIYNLVGDQRLSKFEFACKLANHFSLPTKLLLPQNSDDSKLLAARPKDMSLDNSKARKALGRNLGDVEQFLANLSAQESSGRNAELLKSIKPK
jgi:dTDP-4-dehydrorhamnose reductase